jgi:hypothetical protein
MGSGSFSVTIVDNNASFQDFGSTLDSFDGGHNFETVQGNGLVVANSKSESNSNGIAQVKNDAHASPTIYATMDIK